MSTLNYEYYQPACLEALPVGAVVTVGKLFLKKITDSEVHGKLGPTMSNVLNLSNSHKLTFRTDIPVKPIKEEDLPSGAVTTFAELQVGDKFRWHTVCGVKISDAELSPDWVKHPKSTPANFVDIATEALCIMSRFHEVVRLEE